MRICISKKHFIAAYGIAYSAFQNRICLQSLFIMNSIEIHFAIHTLLLQQMLLHLYLLVLLFLHLLVMFLMLHSQTHQQLLHLVSRNDNLFTKMMLAPYNRPKV
jgi:hypothetical protein